MAANTSTRTAELERPARSLSWVRIGFWISIVIAAAAVIRRVVALGHPATSGPPQMVALDAVFVSHKALTLAHILPALAFVALTPFLYSRRFAGARWVEQFIFPLGAVVGATAYAMSINTSIGGWLERSAVLLFNTLFLYSLARAWQLRHEASLKMEWMTRAIGILFGIATTRPVMGIFFATSPLTHLQPSQFFGIAFWIGFSINTVAVEWWLRSRYGRAKVEQFAYSGPRDFVAPASCRHRWLRQSADGSAAREQARSFEFPQGRLPALHELSLRSSQTVPL